MPKKAKKTIGLEMSGKRGENSVVYCVVEESPDGGRKVLEFGDVEELHGGPVNEHVYDKFYKKLVKKYKPALINGEKINYGKASSS